MADQITARGIVRRGSLVSSPSGAAASNPMKASRQKIMPWNAGFNPSSPGTKTLNVLLSAFTMRSVEMSRKIRYLDDAQHEAGPGGEPDAPVGQAPDHQAAQDRQCDPRELEVDAEVRRQEDRAVEPEPAEQKRHDERLREGEAPGDEPPEERAEPAPDVGVHPACRGQVPGQLGHREGGEQDRDHREQHGERRDAAGEGCGGADRQGGRNGRRHVGDRLEQHLGESDGVRAPAMGFPLRLPRLRSRECPPPMPPLVTTRRALASRQRGAYACVQSSDRFRRRS